MSEEPGPPHDGRPIPSTERGPLAGLADLAALLGAPRSRRLVASSLLVAAIAAGVALVVRRPRRR